MRLVRLPLVAVAFRLFCSRIERTQREDFPMLKTSAVLFFVGAASTAALPLSLGLATAGAAALLLDHYR